MRVKLLGLLTMALLGIPLGAAANDLYFLDLPANQGYETWGTITTDGAAAPATADVVDYKVTVWSDALATGFTLTPSNSTFSWTGVSASPTGLTLGTDISDGWNLGSNLACTPTAFSCYGVVMFNDPITGHRLFYVVLGFGLTDEVVTGIPAPFATRFPLAPPPKLFFVLSHVVDGLETTPTLLEKASAAQRYFDANDAANTCRELGEFVRQAKSLDGNGLDRRSTKEIVAYAESIRTQIACAGCN
jgi:hypothetical protein